MTIPEHPPVPACRFHECRICKTCERVHHGGGDECLTCFGITRLGWPESMRKALVDA